VWRSQPPCCFGRGIIKLEEAPPSAGTQQSDPVARGRDLVTLGNCEGCHTVQGAVSAFAGGRSIPTPFGTFFAPNITQNTRYGIGRWSADDFWSALHNGYAPGRKLLYPTFPIHQLHQDQSDRWGRDVCVLEDCARSLRLPIASISSNFPSISAGCWPSGGVCFFTPGVYEPDTQHDAAWNRGAYLVQGRGSLQCLPRIQKMPWEP